MKKRIAYLISILLLLVVLVTGLIGCVPSRPDKFLKKIFIAEKWQVIEYNIDNSVSKIFIRDKNVSYAKGAKSEQYVIYTKTAVEIYSYTTSSDAWSYQLYTNEDEIKQLIDGQMNSPEFIIDSPDLRYIATDFTTKYSKKDGKWYELSTNPACVYVKGQKLYYEKGDRKIEYALTGKVKISDEALQAKADAIAKN